ncbi:tetratricopeptide repeat-containing sensor histidine kinase [uncultured Dokdonia sp.]|uniref:tetratricopeptide repeat-containing sensor histidine kinase n=1 Tax=uncultured Dokdonia sp. TaxID=575653 RepID=UPI00261E1AFA|nr:tetratricopeptide repeat-containing sensor histidine kinase [uncultured Dokdonia sp.]
MKVILLSFLFFLLSISSLFAQKNEHYRYDDSISALSKEIKELLEIQDYGKAISTLEKILVFYERANDSIGVAKSNYKLGYYNKKLDNYELAFKFYNDSFKIYSSLKDSVQSGRRLMEMSNIQRTLGDYIGSEEMAVDALKYLEGTTDYKNIAGAYHSIAVSKKERGDFNGAEEWNKKTLALLNDTIIKKKINESEIITFLNTKANIQVKKQNYKEAIKQYSALLKDTIIRDNNLQIARIKDNLGFAKWLKDSLDSESILLMKEALVERKQMNNTLGLIASNIHLAKYYSSSDITKAIEYVNVALENSKKINNPSSNLEALEILLNLKNRLNQRVNIESELYVNSTNQLKSLQNKNRDIYKTTKYDFDKTEKENLKLATDNAQKDLRISESQNRNLLLLFGIALLFIISIVVYYLQRQKATQKLKLSQLKERYQTETRLSKKVHDEVGNDIFYLITQLENEPSLLEKNGLKLLDGLQNIYSKARDISREYTDIDTGEGFPDELLSLLNSFGNKEVKIITKQLDPTFWTSVDTDLKSEVFRIVQELLTNMKKHSQASIAAVTFKKEVQELIIQYSDNGIGVDDKKLTLKSVENRIQVLKGVLTLDAQPDEGLQVSIIIPI